MRSIAVVLVLLIAGCAAPAATPANPPRGEAALAAAFAPPALIGPGGDAETSLDVGPDGTILACSHGGGTQAPPMWASTDGGRTFGRITTGDTDVGGDCDVAVGDDAWYQLYTTAVSAAAAGKRGTLPAGLRLATSHDRGATWTLTTPLPATQVEDRPWISARGKTIDITYLPARPLGFGCLATFCNGFDTIMFARSTDGGATWSTPRPAFADTSGPVVLINGHHVTSADAKTIDLPMEVIPSTNNAKPRIVLASSEDGGATWTSSVAAQGDGDLPSFPGAAVAPDGSLVVAYASGSGKQGSVKLARSHDGGKTWDPPVIVSANASFDTAATTLGDIIATVGVALDARGDATLAWLEAVAEGNDFAWTVHAARVDPAGTVAFSGVAAPPISGVWSIAYEFLTVRSTPAGGALVVYPWNAPGCAAKPPGAESGTRNEACVMMLATQPAPR